MSGKVQARSVLHMTVIDGMERQPEGFDQQSGKSYMNFNSFMAEVPIIETSPLISI